MSVTIRPARLYDYDDFCELMAQIDKLHRDQYPDHFREAIPARAFEYYVSVLADEKQYLWVAEVNGKMVGIIQWVITHSRAIPILTPRTAVVIDTLVVHTDYRRQGIGRKLMADLDQWARDHHIVNLELGVWMFNEPAIKFYERLGYSFYRARMHRKLDDR